MERPQNQPEESAFARQLERGFRFLRFEPALEQAFRQDYLRSVRSRVIVCLLLLIGFSVWAVAVNRTTEAAAAPAQFDQIRQWVMRPLSLYLVASALLPALFYRGWLITTPAILAVLGVVGGFGVAGKVVDGNVHAFVAMLSGFLGLYVLMGLLFWQIAVVGTIIATGYVLSLLAHAADPSVIRFETAVLVAMTVLALVFFYGLEKSLRVSFLQRRILEELGRRDSLTGLCNRRVFDEALEGLWQQGLRDDKTVGLLMIDVDHFKNYNDAHGHQAGDRCLRKIARVLAGCERRPLDMVARIGGEEFAVLFYAPAKDHVRACGERILREVRSLAVTHDSSPVAAHVTVSIGAAAVVPELDRTPASLQQFADQALYEAKARGRDRLVLRTEGYADVVTGAFDVPRDNDGDGGRAATR
ncbi:MAG: GGDEF domain-containing protein [Pseudomonadota bacterium]